MIAVPWELLTTTALILWTIVAIRGWRDLHRTRHNTVTLPSGRVFCRTCQSDTDCTEVLR